LYSFINKNARIPLAHQKQPVGYMTIHHGSNTYTCNIILLLCDFYNVQKHWIGLAVRQQERGEKEDQGAGEGVGDQPPYLQLKQLLEQETYPIPGWRKTLGMPG
jgi:hypothetical protein